MNSKIVIPIIVGIIIAIGVIIVITNQESNQMEVEDALDRELRPEDTVPEIQEKLDEIEKINLENEYSPKEREWITSGPFQIDR
ncbi:MAG: hypothetical protein OEY54_06255, partial [Nitrosopumilus sp.]|nr:hypothetical protein [Nitrosopumilus sp.]